MLLLSRVIGDRHFASDCHLLDKEDPMIDTPVNVINTGGLGKAFGGIQALTDLDLRVPKNSIFGFLGPKGAGKTTTIKLMLGLI